VHSEAQHRQATRWRTELRLHITKGFSRELQAKRRSPVSGSDFLTTYKDYLSEAYMDKQAYFKMMGLDKQAAVDPQILKNVLLGAGAGLGTYALSSFLPGARQNRLARLLASLGVGLGTGYFGTDIRNWLSNRSGKKPAAPAVSSAAAQAAIQNLKTPAQVANQI
jgi:hypothetical protein